MTTASEDLLLMRRLSSPQTLNATGVVVAAANADAVRTVSVSAGIAGSAGISLSVDVPVVTATTTAAIGASTQINQGTATAAGSGQSVVVAAANDFYDLGVVGSVAAGGAAGIGGGFAAADVNETTDATIGMNARVKAADDVDVSAEARGDLAAMAASVGLGGLASLNGSVSVLILNDHTKALVDQGATVVAGNNATVVADDETRVATVAGALSLSVGAAAFGAGVSVADVTKDTEATIADNASVSGDAKLGGDQFAEYTDAGPNPLTSTQMGQGVLVQADSGQSFYTIGIAGSVAAGVGAAGAVSVQIVGTTTLAAVDDGAHINTVGAPGSGQDLDVATRDSTGIVSTDGSVAGGLIAGLSGGVDVGVVTSTVGASIGDNVTADASRDVMVDALANKQTSSTVISASGAGLLALAAGVSVYSFGDGVDPNGKGASELKPGGTDLVGNAGSQASGGGTISGSVSSTTSQSSIGATINNSPDATAASGDVNSDFGSVGLSGDVYSNNAVAGTSATIGSAAITAGSGVSIGALDNVSFTSTTGALGVGLGVGLGAGVGIVSDNGTTTASLTGTSTVTAGSVGVSADANHSFGVSSFAGSFALAGAAEASVGIATDTSNTKASVSGETILASGAVDIEAGANRSLQTTANGDAFARGLAAGVSLATSTIGGGVQADVTPDTVTNSNNQTTTTDPIIGEPGRQAGSVMVSAISTRLGDRRRDRLVGRNSASR